MVVELSLSWFFLIPEALMTRTKVFVPSALSVLLSVCVSPALRPQEAIDVESLEQKTVKADLIVIGRVIDAESKWDETRSNIYSYVSLSLEEVIRGCSSTKDITIRITGGAAGEIAAIVQEMPSFRKGERALVFLERDPHSDNFLVVYGRYGKYEISQNNTVISRGVPLAEFLNKIRQYIPK
jgi:hypothetical protein